MSTSILRTEAIRSLSRESFEDFCKHFWDCLPGVPPLLWNWHLSLFCTELQTVAERIFVNRAKEYDLVCNVSPGSSKSSIWSILFNCWCWTRMPAMRFIVASNTERLVLDLAHKTKSVLEHDLYHSCFPEVQIQADRSAKGDFVNTAGGERLSCTVGGQSPIGRHAHCIIIDDPLDPTKALSEVELKAAQTFMEKVISKRKVRTDVDIAVTCLVMQRLHDDDPTGLWLKKAKAGKMRVRHVCLPAELITSEKAAGHVRPSDLVDQYTDGLMDPIRLPMKVLDEERHTDLYSYAGQFLQSPTPLEGGMFKESYFNQRRRAAPYESKRVRYWDRACLLGSVLVRTSRGGVPIKDVHVGDLVLTRCGYKMVKWSGISKWVDEEEVVHVEFPNGQTISGTGDHRVWTEEKNWVELGQMTSKDYTVLCLNQGDNTWVGRRRVASEARNATKIRSGLSLVASFIGASRARSITKRCGGTRRTSDITLMPCIVPSGGPIMGLFQKVGTSTTKMRMWITTTSLIWNACLQRDTQPNTHSIPDLVGSPCGPRGSIKNSDVDIADISSCPEAPWPSIAMTSAGTRPVRLVPVYDLSVEDQPEFFANGVLVHNSSEGRGCQTAGVLMAMDRENNFYVEDVVVGQWEPTERNEIMLATALKDRSRYGPKNEPTIWIEAEGGSSGRDAWKDIARKLAGFSVREDRVTGNKIARAEPWSSALAAGIVWLIDNGEKEGAGVATWDINGYIHEHCHFPFSGLKDRVDSSDGAFNVLKGKKVTSGPVFQSISIGRRKDNLIRILVCTREELAVVESEVPALFIHVLDPDQIPPEITHQLKAAMATKHVHFADIQPSECQDRWEEPLLPYDKLPRELIFSEQNGKALWNFLMRKYPANPGLLIFIHEDHEDRRALSLACAVCDCLRMDMKHVRRLSTEGDVKEVPNKHAFDLMKHCRSLVAP